jgi:hypothetical protein
VVDAIDLLFSEMLMDDVVELASAVEVRAEGLLDDDAAPSAIGRCRETGCAELFVAYTVGGIAR